MRASLIELRRAAALEQGAVSLDVLVLIPLMVFFVFTPFLLDATARDQAFLAVMTDRYLQRAQLDGGFTPAAWDELRTDLEARSLDYSKVRFDGSTPVGQVVLRGEKIYLNIGYPRGSTLSIFQLIGVDIDPTSLVWAGGSILSERPRL